MKRGRVTCQCSFCGKSRDQVRRLISGPGGVNICDECVALCNAIVAEDKQHPGTEPEAQTRVRQSSTGWWQRLLPGRRHRADRPSAQPL